MATAERLVGREAELAQALAAVHRLGEGAAEVLVVTGEPGIGKTRLVRSMVDEATAAGAAVFSSVAHPFERSRPFGVLADALDLRRRSADPHRAALGAMLAGEGLDEVPGDIQYRVVDEVVDLVETACAANPVLLVAEDVHWADPPSLLAVSSLVRRLPLAPLLVVVTLRPSPVSAELAGLLDDLDAAGAHIVDLAALSPEETVALASGVLGATPGPGLSVLLAKAGGNPLWLNALIRSLSDEGRLRRSAETVETTATEIPASLADLVVRRLRALPPVTLELLQLAAVLGDSVPVRDLAVLARRPPTEVVTGLGGAFEAQLLDVADDEVAFRHQLVHDAIHQHTPAATRRVLHREAAVALMAAGAEPLDVADHLVLGSQPGDVEAATWLREAARAAAAQAPIVTVDLLRRAAAILPPRHPEAAPLSCELVAALLRAGRVPEASTLAEEVLAGPHPPEVETPVRLVLLGALALQNRAAELIAVARTGLAGSDGLGPHEQVPMLAQQSWALTNTGDHRAGEETAAKALDLAEQVGEAALTVWALTALCIAVGRQGRYGEALAHARRAATVAAGSRDPSSLPLQPKLFLGLALFDCDLVAEARASYRNALDEEFASGWWLADTLTADAQASFVLGEWEDAVPGLAAAALAAREKGNSLLLSQCLAHRILIATATGDLAGAGELASDLTGAPEEGVLGYNGGVLAAALAGLLAAEGDDRGAYELLLRCWRSTAARGDRFYHRTLAPALVRLALAHGDPGTAAAVASEVAVGAALSPDVASVHALDLRCRGLVHADAELFLEAVAVIRRTPLVLDIAGTCVDAAAVLVERGRAAEATSLLAEALEHYERAGADAWAGSVRARLRALGAQPGARGVRSRPSTGWDSLTSTERAVSVLVAEGLTNGAVARRLYVSPHTVNTHLRHVFAKLGVSNRVQLTGVVHRSIE